MLSKNWNASVHVLVIAGAVNWLAPRTAQAVQPDPTNGTVREIPVELSAPDMEDTEQLEKSEEKKREIEVWVNPGHVPIYTLGLHDLLIFRAGANYYFSPKFAVSLGLMYGTNNLYSDAESEDFIYFRDFSAKANRYEFDLGMIGYLGGDSQSHGFFLRPSIGYSKVSIKYEDDDDNSREVEIQSPLYSLGTGYSYLIAKRLSIAHGITIQGFNGVRSVRLKNFQDDGDDDRIFVDWLFDYIRVDLKIGLNF